MAVKEQRHAAGRALRGRGELPPGFPASLRARGRAFRQPFPVISGTPLKGQAMHGREVPGRSWMAVRHDPLSAARATKRQNRRSALSCAERSPEDESLIVGSHLHREDGRFAVTLGGDRTGASSCCQARRPGRRRWQRGEYAFYGVRPRPGALGPAGPRGRVAVELICVQIPVCRDAMKNARTGCSGAARPAGLLRRCRVRQRRSDRLGKPSDAYLRATPVESCKDTPDGISCRRWPRSPLRRAR